MVPWMYSRPVNHMAVIRPGRTGNKPREATHMSARLVRLDALLFRADSVRFEACATYRGTDGDLCECGWLEPEHAGVLVSRRRMPRRRLPVPVRQTA